MTRSGWPFTIAMSIATSGAHIMAAPATQPLNRQQVLARQRESYLRSLEALEPLQEHRMSRIMQLQLDGGQLVVHSELEPWPSYTGRSARIEGLSTPAVVTYVQFAANTPTARQFDFTIEDYPDEVTFRRLHLTFRPPITQLSIEKTEQTPQGFLRVMYIQSPRQSRLIVVGNGGATAPRVQSFSLAEKDFLTLRQKHSAELERFVRPIFGQLLQDSLFAPDINAAWQVLAAQWPVRQSVRDTIVSLLPQLNAEDSRVRNRAANQIASLGREGASAILRLDRRGLSPEQNARLDEVVSRFKRLSAEQASRLSGDPDFLLDCQYCDDLMVRQVAAKRLSQVLHQPVELDPQAPQEERIDAISHLREELHSSANTQRALR